jgi:hypothetical protein
VLLCRPTVNPNVNIAALQASIAASRTVDTMLTDLDALDAALVGVAGLQGAANNPYTSGWPATQHTAKQTLHGADMPACSCFTHANSCCCLLLQGWRPA